MQTPAQYPAAPIRTNKAAFGRGGDQGNLFKPRAGQTPAARPTATPQQIAALRGSPEHPPTSSKHRRWPRGISSTAGGMGEEAWSRCQSYRGNLIFATTRHSTSLCRRMLDLWYGQTSEGPMPSSTRKSNMHQPTREPMASHMRYNARTNQSGECHPCSARCS